MVSPSEKGVLVRENMTTIIDSRTNKANRSSENRRKFLNRVRSHIKKAIPNIIGGQTVPDLAKKDQEIKIPRKALSEPTFRYKPGKHEVYVLPGNTEYVRGDKIKKKKTGRSKGDASDEDDGSQDDFIIRLNAEEFLNYFFDDLELPDLIKKNLLTTKTFERRNAGYLIDGPPGRLSIVKSLKNSYIRRFALQTPYKRKLEALEDEEPKDDEWLKEKELLEKKIKSIPFLDNIDLRYRNTIKVFKPATTATIISITDCSGSMTEEKKTISRKFFYLLYLFLIRKYENVNLVWIIHTADAREVSEKEFFETQDTGGTIVSTALDLALTIIRERYNSLDNNLYILQSSDGENFEVDNPNVSLCLDKLLPLVQFFGYVQIDDVEPNAFGSSSSLLDLYSEKAQTHKNLQAKRLINERDIWAVFRSLFEKESHDNI